MAVYNLEMTRGDTRVIEVVATRDGSPINLTSGKAWMSARRSSNSNVYIFQKHSDSGGVVLTSPASGIFHITLQPTDTSTLPNESVGLSYDVQIKESDGKISTIVTGTLTVTPDITQEIV